MTPTPPRPPGPPPGRPPTPPPGRQEPETPPAAAVPAEPPAPPTTEEKTGPSRRALVIGLVVAAVVGGGVAAALLAGGGGGGGGNGGGDSASEAAPSPVATDEPSASTGAGCAAITSLLSTADVSELASQADVTAADNGTACEFAVGGAPLIDVLEIPTFDVQGTPTTTIAGVGDAAYARSSDGVSELTVQQGSRIFTFLAKADSPESLVKFANRLLEHLDAESPSVESPADPLS
ncbi:MAG TPA: hypothetical protein VIH82_10755 [Acidimicrobiia bacterium]